MYTNKSILVQAKESVTMSYAGHNQYTLDTWSASHNAWYQGNNHWTYCQAKSNLKEKYIESVLDIIYINPYRQFRFFAESVHDYADWRSFARDIINYARDNKQGIFAE